MHTLDTPSQAKLDARRSRGEEILHIAWTAAPNPPPEGEDRTSAASDAVSDILTALFGPAGVMIPKSDARTVAPGHPSGYRSHMYETGAADFLDAALRAYEGDHEDYTVEPSGDTASTNVGELAARAFDVLTNHDISPSTRDLITVQGIGADLSQWADGPSERLWLLDEILGEYEEKASVSIPPSERDLDAAVNAIRVLRVDVQAATCREEN